MIVSNEYLVKLCRQADYEVTHHNASLCLRDALALDLRDARARVAKLEAQLVEAKKDGDRLDFIIGRFQEVSHRVVDALGISTDEHFKDVGDGEMEIDWRAAIAAAAAEREKG